MPPAGPMRHRVDVQARTQTADNAGAMVSTWATIESRWARVRPISSREFQEGKATIGQVSHEITLRYFPGLTVAHRIMYGTRTFELVSVVDTDERHRETKALALERA